MNPAQTVVKIYLVDGRILGIIVPNTASAAEHLRKLSSTNEGFAFLGDGSTGTLIVKRELVAYASVETETAP